VLTSILGTSANGFSANTHIVISTQPARVSLMHPKDWSKNVQKIEKAGLAYLVSYDYHWRTLPFKLNYYRF
jgi:hypothetical protein